MDQVTNLTSVLSIKEIFKPQQNISNDRINLIVDRNNF